MELLRRISCIIGLMALVSCGSGSLSSTGTTTNGSNPSTATETVTLTISSVNVTGKSPATLTATVMKGSTPVTGDVVTFTNTLGALSPNSGTALTDANGVATIILTAGSVRGAGTVSAKSSSGAEGKVGFSTQGDDLGIVGDIQVSVALVDVNGNPTSTITASKPGKLVATVQGNNSPQIVTFTTTVGDIPIATAITDSNNQATVDIQAGNTLGAGTAKASIESGQFGKTLLVVGASNVFMGTGTPFVKGQADISLAQISAGGTSVVSVSIVDDQGHLYTEPVDVNFSSGCSGLATPTATLSSPVTTSNGVATSTYLAKGCVGDDPIHATANAGGISLSANTSVNVLPADVGSIEFVSATPANIALLGTGALGGSESSTVVFKVLDTNSNPVNNQVVNFALNTNVGGIKLNPSSATTDNNGLVQTVINSGTVATSVRVLASIDGSSPLIASQSSVLVVSTGIPDQDSFSLSADVLNPEGWDIDGSSVKVTARLADAFNNPVPDGTAVTFTTEGGAIEPSCVTVNGACTVTWHSQLPRPTGKELITEGHSPEVKNTMGQKYGGRATILATAIGEESFPDLNGNGRFDASEMAAFAGKNVSGAPYDLKEAFVDHNEDGFYNPDSAEAAMAPADPNNSNSGALEEFIDFNNDGVFSQNDGKYNGVLCSIPAHSGCSSQKSINVRGSLVVVMSGSNAFFKTQSTNDAVATTDPNYNSADNSVYIAGENTGSATVTISDLHNQPMPAGTKVIFTTTAGAVVGPSSFVWPNDNHNGGRTFGVSIQGEKQPKSGKLIITVETPSGTLTTYSAISVVIQ